MQLHLPCKLLTPGTNWFSVSDTLLQHYKKLVPVRPWTLLQSQ